MGPANSRGQAVTSGRPWRWAAAAVLALSVCVLLIALRSRRRNQEHQLAPPPVAVAVNPSSPYLNTVLGVAYVGDGSCARCHAEIASSFRDHPMGRSMTTADRAKPVADGVVFTVGDFVYSILHPDGKLVHREQKRDSSGKIVATNEAEISYVLGSGRRGASFLVERDSRLFQSPISWYSHENRWDLPPGYERQNLHFDRVIPPNCLFCHTNRVDFQKGRSPVFHGLGIGCERCHGPGELHERQPHNGDGPDFTIVNPAKLEPPSLREAVCEQCHLQGTSRLDQPDHSEFEYRPGLPLETFVHVSLSRASAMGRSRAVGQVEQMRESACYRKSGKELGCISCHDPHRLPAVDERVGYYRNRCLECHADRGCSLPLPARRAQNPADDCIACHMPDMRASDIAHTALSDHSIPRNPSAIPPH
jgi:Cytochrome c554 and c-prime